MDKTYLEKKWGLTAPAKFLRYKQNGEKWVRFFPKDLGNCIGQGIFFYDKYHTI